MLLLILSAVEEGHGGGGGFNPFDAAGIGGILWTWVIFLAAMIPIWKFVMGPITRALGERDDLARQAITEAQTASEEAEKARAEVEVSLGEARAEAAQFLSEARERAGVRERELVEEAQEKSRELLETARRSIQAEQDKAISAIREEVVDLTLAGASKVLSRNVGSEDDRKLVSDLVGQMKGST